MKPICAKFHCPIQVKVPCLIGFLLPPVASENGYFFLFLAIRGLNDSQMANLVKSIPPSVWRDFTKLPMSASVMIT